MISSEERELLTWSRWLLVLGWVAIAWSLIAIVNDLFFTEITFALSTVSGVKVLTDADFTRPQRMFLIVVASCPEICWIWCMCQITRLARRFSQGEIMTPGMIHCFDQFGRGLVAQSLCGLAILPVVTSFLRQVGKIDAMKDPWSDFARSAPLGSLTAAVFVMIVARIFRIGIRLQEDAELTI